MLTRATETLHERHCIAHQLEGGGIRYAIAPSCVEYVGSKSGGFDSIRLAEYERSLRLPSIVCRLRSLSVGNKRTTRVRQYWIDSPPVVFDGKNRRERTLTLT